jgi:hypothetical protein
MLTGAGNHGNSHLMQHYQQMVPSPREIKALHIENCTGWDN